jgi:uncharacterized protein (TIGR02300 family)
MLLPMRARSPICGGHRAHDGVFAFDRMRRLWQCRAGYYVSDTVRRFSSDREYPLAKPEWGTKRICPSCGTRYYDLLREQVVCPKCSTPYDPEAFLKARRARPVAPVEKELAPVGDTDAEEVEVVEDEEALPLAAGDEEEEEELIEDASELGEDEDDMAEVIDNVEEEEP